jgi:hypothetical protein
MRSAGTGVSGIAASEPAEDLGEGGVDGAGRGGSAASCGAIVCSVVIDPGVTPRTSQRRSSPLPISTVTMRCEVDSGSIATLLITPAPPAPPSGVRLRNHSVSGIAATIAQNQSNELKPPGMSGAARR